MNPQDPDSTLEDALAASAADVLAHPERYSDSAQLQLPLDKREVPKLVLLDANHWINLWRAHVNDPRATVGARHALNVLRSAIASGKAIVACTSANIGELSAWKDPASRVRRIEFLIEMSQNHSLVSALTVRAVETIAAVLRVYRNVPGVDGIRGSILRLGVEHALGSAAPKTGHPVLDRVLPLIARHPRMSVHVITQHIHDTHAKTKIATAPILEQAIKVRALDQGLSYEERLRRELEVSYAECGPKLLQLLGVDPAEFQAWLNTDDNRHAFWLSIPSVDVSLTLFLRRDKDIRALTEANDVHDVQLLELALPYANIVLTEKSWRHIAVQAQLDTKYNCTVLASLEELEASLRVHGCV